MTAYLEQEFSRLLMESTLVSCSLHELGHVSFMVSARVESLSRKLRRHQKELSEVIVEMEELQYAAKRLEDTIKSIRFLGQQPERRHRSFTLAAALESVASSLGGVLNRTKIDLKYSAPEEIILVGDQPALEMVFFNLTMNSIEAISSTHPRSRGIIEVDCHQAAEDQIRVLWRDDGPGITVDIADKIFDRGFTTSQERPGFGLYIVRSLLHKSFAGDICLVNLESATFELTIPKKKDCHL